jgi:hypothetical protein
MNNRDNTSTIETTGLSQGATRYIVRVKTLRNWGPVSAIFLYISKYNYFFQLALRNNFRKKNPPSKNLLLDGGVFSKPNQTTFLQFLFVQKVPFPSVISS